jgi:hypothetical protein
MAQTIAKTAQGPIEYRLEGSGPTVVVLNGAHSSRTRKLILESAVATDWDEQTKRAHGFYSGAPKRSPGAPCT